LRVHDRARRKMTRRCPPKRAQRREARSSHAARKTPRPAPRYPRHMPAPTAAILAELDRLLEPARFDDYCVNGLQVPGPAHVDTLVTGVSAHAELFELAAHERAQLLLVHHGLFWGAGVAAIDPILQRRLRLLFDADIALAAYHLPLDAHPELGNNALLARALGADTLAPFALHHGQPIGFIATMPGDGHGDGIPAADLFARVAEVTAREPLVFDAGPPRVRRLAIVTGAGADYTADAAAAGADALLTGEPAERSMAQAREAHIHLIAAGHHATETFGVRRLGEHLAERFALRHVFIDVPNPV
jgi:dinuclear metal center YbgI/SA1388 family protein